MQRCVLVLLAACGSTTATVAVEQSVNVSSSLNEDPTATPPPDLDVHLHETPSYTADIDKLYVEVTADDEHGDVLRQSAAAGLTSTDFVVPVSDGGDIELHVEVATLAAEAHGTSCRVKIFVLRMPQHDLLAIADGGARVTGKVPSDECLSATGTSIVREKLPILFRRQLEAKQ
jgi:hypothetical protein